ncbi:MAG: VOC family protein [Vulcanimicrobiaceae bacterium]
MTTPDPAAAGPITGLDFTRYFVKDMERALAFYRDTLGMTVTTAFAADFVEFTLADGSTFALDKQETWLEGNSASFGVADIRTAVARYRERGVEFLYAGEIFESPVCSFAFARDSEGNTFMLHQRKRAG